MHSIDVDEGYEDEQSYVKDDVRLIVETVDESLVITYAQLEAREVYELTILFIDKLAAMTGQAYNSVLNDLKEIEEGD